MTVERRPRHMASDDDEEIVRTMWLAGDKIVEIMAATGLSASGVSSMATGRLGLKPRHRKWEPHEHALVEAKVNELIDRLMALTDRSPVSIANHVASAAMKRKKG